MIRAGPGQAARLTAVVVLPTPPFWLAIVMMRQLAGRGHDRSSPAPRTPTAASAARPIGVSCGFCGTSGITTEPTSPRPWAAVPPCIASSTTVLPAFLPAFLRLLARVPGRLMCYGPGGSGVAAQSPFHVKLRPTMLAVPLALPRVALPRVALPRASQFQSGYVRRSPRHLLEGERQGPPPGPAAVPSQRNRRRPRCRFASRGTRHRASPAPQRPEPGRWRHVVPATTPALPARRARGEGPAVRRDAASRRVAGRAIQGRPQAPSRCSSPRRHARRSAPRWREGPAGHGSPRRSARSAAAVSRPPYLAAVSVSAPCRPPEYGRPWPVVRRYRGPPSELRRSAH